MSKTVKYRHGFAQMQTEVSDSSVSESLFRELILRANDAYFIFRISVNGEVSPFLEVNPTACKTTGYSQEELLNMTFIDLAKGYMPEGQIRQLQNEVFVKPYTSMEWVHITRDGRRLPLELSIRVVQENAERVVFLVARDISERKEFEHALHTMAYFDDKTSLPNRRRFLEVVEETLERAKQSATHPGIMFVDLDNFKQINNVFGYTMGDKILVTAARRLRSCFPSNCTVSRWGDDEFLVLVPDGDYDLQRELLVRMRSVFNQPFAVADQTVFLTLTAGIATYPTDGTSTDALIQNAGTAVTAAKRQGKGQVVRYTDTLHKRVTERLQLASDLRKAVASGEFCVYFQPEVLGNNGSLVGMEALVRWKHPERGLVLPDNFISVAEEVGLIGALGEEVLRESFKQAKAWESKGLKDYRMAINLSVLQLQQPEFLRMVSRVFEDTNMNPAHCQFEITESVFMHVDEVEDILTSLQDFGITLAIDDFGTGFSSLSYLRKLPIHMLKVDKSFVRNILTSKNDSVIVRAIVELAHHLGLQVVAEGVETAQQEEVLRNLECDFMQGYYYSRPVTPEYFEQQFIVPILR